MQGVPGGNVVGPGELHVPIDRPHAFFKNDAAVAGDGAAKVAKRGVYDTAVDYGAAIRIVLDGAACNSSPIDHKITAYTYFRNSDKAY